VACDWNALKPFLGTPFSGVADDGSVGEVGAESQPTSPATTTAPPRRPTRVNLLRIVVNGIPFRVIVGVQEQRKTGGTLHPPRTSRRTTRFFGSTRRVSPPNRDLVTKAIACKRHLNACTVTSSPGARQSGSPARSGSYICETIPRGDQNAAARGNDLTQETRERRTSNERSAFAGRAGDFS
jgi:hypothetical protein